MTGTGSPNGVFDEKAYPFIAHQLGLPQRRITSQVLNTWLDGREPGIKGRPS